MPWACWSQLSSIFGPTVPESLCRPGALYKNERIDQKKLRKLIMDGKLVPIFSGMDEASPPPPEHELYCSTLQKLLKQKKQECGKLQETLAEYEACPVCFLHYPVLNTSRCCSKRICTECYLQVQTARSSIPACPFCKLPGFSAKFVGVKTTESREAERVEEQKVIEARIREREEEVRRDQAREEQRRATASGELPADASPAAHPVTEHGHATLPPIAAASQRSSSPAYSTPGRAAANRTASNASSPTRAGRQRNENGSSVARGSTGQVVALSQLDARSLAQAQQQMEEQAAVQSAARQASGASARQRVSATAAAQVTAAAGQRRARAGGNAPGAGGYRLADYVPTGVVDIAVDVEDINDFMLEQAMYESLAAGGGDGLPGQAGAEPLSPVAAVGLASPTAFPATSPTAARRNPIVSTSLSPSQPVLVFEEDEQGSGQQSSALATRNANSAPFPTPSETVRQALRNGAGRGFGHGMSAAVLAASRRQSEGNAGGGGGGGGERASGGRRGTVGGFNIVPGNEPTAVTGLPGSPAAPRGEEQRQQQQQQQQQPQQQQPTQRQQQPPQRGHREGMSEEQELELAIQLSLAMSTQPAVMSVPQVTVPSGIDTVSLATPEGGSLQSQVTTSSGSGGRMRSLQADATPSPDGSQAGGLAEEEGAEEEGALVSVRTGSAAGRHMPLQLPASPPHCAGAPVVCAADLVPRHAQARGYTALSVPNPSGEAPAFPASPPFSPSMPLPPIAPAAAQGAEHASRSPGSKRKTGTGRPASPSPFESTTISKSSNAAESEGATRNASTPSRRNGHADSPMSREAEGEGVGGSSSASLLPAVGAGESLVKAGPLGEGVDSAPAAWHPNPTSTLQALLAGSAPLTPTTSTPGARSPVTETAQPFPHPRGPSSSGSMTLLMQRLSPPQPTLSPAQVSRFPRENCFALPHAEPAGPEPWHPTGTGNERPPTQHPWDNMTNPFYDTSLPSSPTHSMRSDLPLKSGLPMAVGGGLGEQHPFSQTGGSSSAQGTLGSVSSNAQPAGMTATGLQGTISSSALSAMPQQQRAGFANGSVPMPTAEAVAATQPSTIHLGMAFAVWSTTALQTGEGSEQLQQQPLDQQQPGDELPLGSSGAAASSKPAAVAVTETAVTVEAFLEDCGTHGSGADHKATARSEEQGEYAYYDDGWETSQGVMAAPVPQQQRLLIIQNPDGTICGASAAPPDPVPVETVVNVATREDYSQAFLRAEARRLADERRTIDSSAYDDYDVGNFGNEEYGDYEMDLRDDMDRDGASCGRLQTVTDSYRQSAAAARATDDRVTQHIVNRDAQLQAAYCRG